MVLPVIHQGMLRLFGRIKISEHYNHIINSKYMASLLNGRIWHIGLVATESVCAWSLRSGHISYISRPVLVPVPMVQEYEAATTLLWVCATDTKISQG